MRLRSFSIIGTRVGGLRGGRGVLVYGETVCKPPSEGRHTIVRADAREDSRPNVSRKPREGLKATRIHPAAFPAAISGQGAHRSGWGRVIGLVALGDGRISSPLPALAGLEKRVNVKAAPGHSLPLIFSNFARSDRPAGPTVFGDGGGGRGVISKLGGCHSSGLHATLIVLYGAVGFRCLLGSALFAHHQRGTPEPNVAVSVAGVPNNIARATPGAGARRGSTVAAVDARPPGVI